MKTPKLEIGDRPDQIFGYQVLYADPRNPTSDTSRVILCQTHNKELAQLVVRAVNSHAALVQACKAIVDCNCDDQPEDWGSVEWCEWVGQAIEQAQTALATAKEVQS